MYRFISVNLVDFLYGAGEAPCAGSYLVNVDFLFHVNVGNLIQNNVKNCFVKQNSDFEVAITR